MRRSNPCGPTLWRSLPSRMSIFRHADDNLGPAGMEEWMAFVKDSEGNTVGLISHHKPETSE